MFWRRNEKNLQCDQAALGANDVGFAQWRSTKSLGQELQQVSA
jgi:hypothetical protein